MVVSNSAQKSKLKYNDIRDLILSKEVCGRDVDVNNAQDQALVMENKGINRTGEPDDRVTMSQSKSISQFQEMRECFHCRKKEHIKRNFWHWNKDEKNDNEKNTTIVVFDKDVVILSLQEQKYEHVAKNNIEWVVDLEASHHVIPTKGLFCQKIWFCISYKTNSGSNKHESTSFMRDNM